MLSVTGCIVADPPQYEEPRRTPPILHLGQAQPLPYRLIVVDRLDSLDAQDKVPFKVPFRSDDQGESVCAGLHANYRSNESVLLRWITPVPPSTIDDSTRDVSFSWDTRDGNLSSGCHQLTLLVAHESSWEVSEQQPLPDAPADDIALGTWWIHLDPEPGSDPFTLPGCPNQAEIEQ